MDYNEGNEAAAKGEIQQTRGILEVSQAPDSPKIIIPRAQRIFRGGSGRPHLGPDPAEPRAGATHANDAAPEVQKVKVSKRVGRPFSFPSKR